ncbi:MAG: DUF4351 domain-containing protein [Pyrinomonadaceae bacterium]|nr:DUF4351 domain-containing protein [Pyrinomonadaceae bacterium]
MAKYDLSGKNLISISPETWVKWATKLDDVVSCEIVSGEMQFISRDTDSLVRVVSKSAGEILVLFEIQMHYRPEMPRRMRAYAALAEEKYGLLVYPILVNIISTRLHIPTRYESTIMNLSAVQEYRVFNLWEVSADETLRENHTVLLPFVPLMKGGDSEDTLQRTSEQIKTAIKLEQGDQLEKANTILRLFASFVFESDVLDRILGGDMQRIIEETPFYQEILRRGLRDGIEKGIAEGKAKGLTEGKAEGIAEGIAEGETLASKKILIKLLMRKFGALSDAITVKINGLNFEKSETLAEEIFDFPDLQSFELRLDEVKSTQS